MNRRSRKLPAGLLVLWAVMAYMLLWCAAKVAVFVAAGPLP